MPGVSLEKPKPCLERADSQSEGLRCGSIHQVNAPTAFVRNYWMVSSIKASSTSSAAWELNTPIEPRMLDRHVPAPELPIFKMLLVTALAQVTKEVTQVGADGGDEHLIRSIGLDVIHKPKNPSSCHTGRAYP